MKAIPFCHSKPTLGALACVPTRILLALIALLFSSCATTGAIYSSSTLLDVESTQYGKGFELRKNGERYILSYRYAYSDTGAAHLEPPWIPAERSFAAMGKDDLRRLCGRGPLPGLILQKLVIESGHSPAFEAGTPVDLGSVGCPDHPLFKIVDARSIRKAAKIGIVPAGVAADAALFYAFPLAYAGVVAAGAVVAGLLAARFFLEGQH